MSNRLNPNRSKTKYFKPSGSGRKMIPCTEAENEEHRARCAVQAHLFKTIEILCDMGYKEIAFEVRAAADTKTRYWASERKSKPKPPQDANSWVEYCEARGITY